MLVAQSEYFRSLFLSGMQEARRESSGPHEVELGGLSAATFRVLLCNLYTAEVPVGEDSRRLVQQRVVMVVRVERVGGGLLAERDKLGLGARARVARGTNTRGQEGGRRWRGRCSRPHTCSRRRGC